jgi:hypothetical protein
MSALHSTGHDTSPLGRIESEAEERGDEEKLFKHTRCSTHTGMARPYTHYLGM